jgi:hypothetical protein
MPIESDPFDIKRKAVKTYSQPIVDDRAEVRQEIAEGAAEEAPREPEVKFFPSSLGALVIEPLVTESNQTDN